MNSFVDYLSKKDELEMIRKMSNMEIVEEVKKSGLRGRGGAGFAYYKDDETPESGLAGLIKQNMDEDDE